MTNDDMDIDQEIAEAEAEPHRQRAPEATWTVQPLYDRVLVRRHPEAETYGENGVILKPDSARDIEKRLTGTVLEVGEGLPLPDGRIRKMRVHKDDIVLFGSYAGVDLPEEISGPAKDLIMVREEELLAILAQDVPESAGA